MATRADYFKLHFIVFLWGFSGILGKLVSIPAYEMVFYRTLLSALGLAAVMVFLKVSFRISGKQLGNLLLIGLIVGLHWLAFFEAARVSNVSVSLVGFATNSLWTAIMEPLFNRSRIKKFELLLGLIVMFGLYVIFSFDFQYHLGLTLGILAGFTSALFSIFNSRMVQTLPPLTISLYEMIGAFIGLGLLLPIYQLTWAPNHSLSLFPGVMDWTYMIILAGACSVYAYSAAIELMKKVSVFLIQLTLNLEPVYGIIMAVIIFKSAEKMGWNFYLGTLIILSAVLFYPYLKRRYDRRVVINS
jgi:drug/metabolite transporter (DMT)-like permease